MLNRKALVWSEIGSWIIVLIVLIIIIVTVVVKAPDQLDVGFLRKLGG